MEGDGTVYLTSDVGGGQILKIARRKGSGYHPRASMDDICEFLTMADCDVRVLFQDEGADGVVLPVEDVAL